MRHIIPLFALTVALGATAERICIDNDWRFAFGHAQFIIHNPHSCPVSITLGDES